MLLRFEPRSVLKRLAWAAGCHPLRVTRLLWSRRLIDEIERGQISGEEMHRLFRAELGFSGDYPAFRRLWCDHFALDRPVESLYRRLARERAVYLLSNTNRLHYDYIRGHYAFPRYAAGAVLSYRLGLRKPEPAIYRAALAAARVAPAEALLIDDRPENVDGAVAVGMRAVRFLGVARLRSELGALGLLPLRRGA